MKIVFHASSKDREQTLAEAFCAGAALHGHEAVIAPLTDDHAPVECDLACMVGVKSKRLYEACKAAGQHVLMHDKGYVRHRHGGAWEYWRVSLDAHHPTQTTLMRAKMPSDRFERLGLELKPWRRRGMHVLFIGSSEKYHDFYDLPHPTRYAKSVIAQIAAVTDRPIIYRPKPSWRAAVPVKGSFYSDSKQPLQEVLTNAYCIVTHGSNACFEATLAGVPSIILGDAIAAPIAATSLDQINVLPMGKRLQWLYNLSYHQWTEAEMASGEAWQTIGGWLNA